MAFNREKFKALVHYICSKVDSPSRLGATKLNKVLWFSDVLTYLNLNEPITDARYVKRQFGPVPAAILPVIEELRAEGILAVREVEYYSHQKREFFALQEPDLSHFSAAEISIVDTVIQQVCYGHTATSISGLTHNDAWEMADIGEDLPYYTVFAARRDEINEDDTAWAEEKIARLVGA